MDKHQKQFVKIIESLGYRFSVHDVFRDFCEMASWNLRRPFYEAEALTVFERLDSKYDQEHINVLAEAFAHMVLSLEDGYKDFLGECYMSMELGNSYKGQFFTPYHLCKLMARCNIGNDIKSKLNPSGYVTVSDPACGAGATLVAAVEEARNQGLNPSTNLLLYATDVDITAVNMCYLQLSLCGVAALVAHGNTLSMEIYSQYLTPVYFLNNWAVRYNAQMAYESMVDLEGTKGLVGVEIETEVAVASEILVKEPAIIKPGQMAFDFMIEKEAV